MADVTPGYTFTGVTDPITYSKLNLMGQPTVAVGAAEVGTNELDSNITISGLTIHADTPFINSATTESFSGTMTITISSAKGTTRVIACTSNTAATLNASAGGTAGQELNFLFSTDGTAGNVITFGTNFKSTGTYTLASASKYYVACFISNGTYWIERSRTAAVG